MKIEIRKAGIEDIDLLLDWRMEVLHEVFSLPSDQNYEELKEENRNYYEKALPLGEHAACFAFADGKIVGCGGICFHREMPSPDNPSGNCAYLMNVYTRDAYRHNGIGKMTVGWLIEQAKNRNITKIYLETSEKGKNLYERLGFSDMAGMMKLK